MYIPKQFRSDDIEFAKEFISQIGFGLLISQFNNRPYATHIPLILDTNNGKDVLVGHLARANKQWTEFNSNNEVLVIFSGPHSYVSSSWYNHENVPTWNYQSVHVYGKIRLIEGEYLKLQLDKLINKYERGLPNPIRMDKMNPEFLSNEIRGIVGFEIEITEYQIASKMSQNRDSINKDLIIDGLMAKGDANSIQIAEIMKNDNK